MDSLLNRFTNSKAVSTECDANHFGRCKWRASWQHYFYILPRQALAWDSICQRSAIYLKSNATEHEEVLGIAKKLNKSP